MPANLETQQWPQYWKWSVFIPIPKKGNAKECSNYCTTVLISHTSKIMLKIIQARLQQFVNWELPDVQAGFRKGGGTRDQIANIRWITEKARKFQKNIYFCFTDYLFCSSLLTTANGECIHEIKGHLLLGRKAVTNLESVLKSRGITLLTSVHIVKAMVFPVMMYECESWP